MKLENTGLDGLTVELARLDEIMDELGIVRAGQWDYERVTYDRKFENKDETFYLRIPGFAVEGDIGGKHAVVKLMTPLLGKHYYPHGVEYGEGENFPNAVLSTSQKLLKQLKEEIGRIV